jgi:hypothetical protein
MARGHPGVRDQQVKSSVYKSSLTAFCLVLLGAASLAAPARAQPALPQWLPIATLDKPFNDAAKDIGLRHRFALRDCGNFNKHFICTYGSETGIGVAAWASQPVGLVEQMNIAIPRCTAEADLADVAAMLLHILHPRRPLSTFSRAIVAMARFAEHAGSGEHWLDGVSYHLIERGPLGLGLVVRRTPPNAVPPNAAMRKRVAEAQKYYAPEFDCPHAASIVIEPVARPPADALRPVIRSISK